MSSFWGTELKPDKPYTPTHSPRRGRVLLSQATLGAEVGKVDKGKTNLVQLQCTIKNKEPVYLCALIPGQSVTCHLNLEFEEKDVTFSVLGTWSIHLSGYYVGESLQGSDEDFLASRDDDVVIPISHEQMNTDSEDDSGFDDEYGSEDAEDLSYDQAVGKSSVFIEIQEDVKPAAADDNSKLQLAVGTPADESVESVDEDGFPFYDSKKSSEDSEDDSDFDDVYGSDDAEDLSYDQAVGKSSVFIEIQEDVKPAADDDNSKLQLAVGTPAESVESVDEGSSKKYNKKRESDDIYDPHE